MPKTIDAGRFGFPKSTVIQQLGPGHYALVINRKSRIIMADGARILAKAEIIRQTIPGSRVSLRTTAPVCGKTRTFLQDRNVELLP